MSGEAGPPSGAAGHGPRRPARVAVLTARDTRTVTSDESGRLLAEGLTAAGHQVVARRIVADDAAAVEAGLRELLALDADAVVVTRCAT